MDETMKMVNSKLAGSYIIVDEVTTMSLVAPFLQHGVQRRVFLYIKVETS